MVAETQAANPPNSCSPSDFLPGMIFATLLSIWVNDTRFADYLQAEYGINAHAAEIMREDIPGVQQTWRWNEPGQPASELRTPMNPALEHFDFRGARWFWFNETGVSAIDLRWEYDATGLVPNLLSAGASNRATLGILQPPMTGSTTSAYAAPGEWQANVSWTGNVTKYLDHLCAKPVP